MGTNGPAVTGINNIDATCRIKPGPATATEKRIVLVIAILAGFLTPFDGSAVNIALPTIGAAFHMDAISLSWVATAYLLASALFLVPFGRIADIYGRKKIFLCGISLFALASFLMTLVVSPAQMIAVRIFQGVGSAMIFGTSVAILTSVYPPGERGRALGIYITSVYLGLSVGPFLGGLLTETLGWRSIFYVNIPMGIAIIGIVLLKLKGEWAECENEPFDIKGSLFWSASLVAVIAGFSLLPSYAGILLVVTGAVFAVIFVSYEKTQEYPVLNINLFLKNRVFAFSNLAALINYSATYAIAFLMSLDLQYTKGFSPESAGLVVVAAPVIQALVSPFAGKLSDRYDSQIISSAGMGCTAAGLLMLVFLTAATPLWYIVLSLVVVGLGFGLFSSPNTNAIMGSVEKRYYGVSSGIIGTMRLLGQMLSMGIATMIFALVIGKVEITPDYYPQFVTSLHYAFLIFTVLCIFGIFASLARGRQENHA